MEHNINVNLKIWRQRSPKEPGAFKNYRVENVSTGSSFLEMLDMLNPVSYTHLTLPTN